MQYSTFLWYRGFYHTTVFTFHAIVRASTTFKSEGEVTSLSGADKREVKQQGEVVRVEGEVIIFLYLYHFSHSQGIIVAFVCYNVLVIH